LDELSRRAVMVASPRPEEGRTSTVITLARAMAKAGRRVIVVDLDLHNPSLHSRLNVPNEIGIAQVLGGQATAQQSVRFARLGSSTNGSSPGCYVMPAGRSVSDPLALIETDRTRLLIETLAKQADVVLVDSPPLLERPDGFLIAQSIGTALLVIESGRTVAKDLTQSHEGLARNHVRILGAILATDS
jgi:capsular exopolysaccharide synthesis family protein